MKFYLGTHEPTWLRRSGHIRWCLARQRLWRNGRGVPEATSPWMLDSGAYQELDRYHRWTITPKEYVAIIRRARDEVGNLEWAAPMDSMCEPWILAKCGTTTLAQQYATVQNFLDLMSIDDTLPIKPALQGWEPWEYLHCAGMYDSYGVDLSSFGLVGVGGLCRLQDTDKAGAVLDQLAPLQLPLHGFGFKMKGLVRYGHRFATGDSMAWSYNARKNPPLPGCTHKRCNNCFRRAVWWRERLLAQIGEEE